jgi:hypothetical protein
MPVERIGPDGVARIGGVDGRRGLPEDMASDRALKAVTDERRFVRQYTTRFELRSECDSMGELIDHLGRSTLRRTPPSKSEVSRWVEACKGAGEVRLRIRESMQLGVYVRRGIGRPSLDSPTTQFGEIPGAR